MYAMENGYDILLECAPSTSQGMIGVFLILILLTLIFLHLFVLIKYLLLGLTIFPFPKIQILTHFGALTGIDSYDHANDINMYAMENGYDILLECAPSTIMSC